jgi:hypothetical protein
MDEMHFSTPFSLIEGRNQRLQLRACRVNVVAIQCVGYPFELVAKLVGSTPASPFECPPLPRCDCPRPFGQSRNRNHEAPGDSDFALSQSVSVRANRRGCARFCSRH